MFERTEWYSHKFFNAPIVIRYIRAVVLQNVADHLCQRRIRYLVGDCFQQFRVIDVVEILSKINLQHVTVRSIPVMMPTQMLLESSARKCYAFACETGSVIVYEITAQYRYEARLA